MSDGSYLIHGVGLIRIHTILRHCVPISCQRQYSYFALGQDHVTATHVKGHCH